MSNGYELCIECDCLAEREQDCECPCHEGEELGEPSKNVNGDARPTSALQHDYPFWGYE